MDRMDTKQRLAYIEWSDRGGDWEGEYTYAGARGRSVIDYIIVNETARDKIKRMEVGERIDSDHMPLIITIEGEYGRRKKEKEEKEEERRKEIKKQ